MPGVIVHTCRPEVMPTQKCTYAIVFGILQHKLPPRPHCKVYRKLNSLLNLNKLLNPQDLSGVTLSQPQPQQTLFAVRVGAHNARHHPHSHARP